ncbi:MAG: hydrogenase maturation nickel metallochaperone HypA [Syntrophales bacterium]|nr:hydrogenase maturation nickel metallochaperone HypA [Syntrophales bacterium]
MHELSLVNELLEIINRYDETHHFERVNSLKLSFGRLSCIDPGALQFAFDVQSQGTKAQGATLSFDIHPIIIRCLTCDGEAIVERYPTSCPECRGETVLMTGGTESLKFLEMDVD